MLHCCFKKFSVSIFCRFYIPIHSKFNLKKSIPNDTGQLQLKTLQLPKYFSTAGTGYIKEYEAGCQSTKLSSLPPVTPPWSSSGGTRPPRAAVPPAPSSTTPAGGAQGTRPLAPVQPYARVYTRRARAAPPPPPAAGAPPLPKGAVPVAPVVNEHRMVTRAKLGFRQPALFTSTPLSPVPKTFRSALADPNWRAAMEEEHAALLRNHTCDLVPRPPRANVVTGKWIFKHKLQADGSLERYKAR